MLSVPPCVGAFDIVNVATSLHFVVWCKHGDYVKYLEDEGPGTYMRKK
jgi:hypothetical protein